MIFDPQKGGFVFSPTFLTPPKKVKKVGFKLGGGVQGGLHQKLIPGCVYSTR